MELKTDPSVQILAAAHEPRVLRSIQDLLKDDFEVIAETDPHRALEILRERPVGVILASREMPDFSGDAFLARAREVSPAARILMTDRQDEHTMFRAVNEAHIYAYILEPWNPQELQKLVYKASAYFRNWVLPLVPAQTVEDGHSGPDGSGRTGGSGKGFVADGRGGAMGGPEKSRTTRVFLVDDDIDDISLCEAAWRRTGFSQELRAFSDGQKLMEYLYEADSRGINMSSSLPDLIFLDLDMPNKDGFETLSELKSHALSRDIPVVMFTNSMDGIDVRKSYRLGADGFISKPASFQGLCRALETAIAYWLEVVKRPDE